ncbi:DUF3048 domain-containing protein [Kitasatospora sp. NBC_00070]|uniref:DUF3048 domain-containing protein n=1 Tax=Kitasatospora sp. NBC_00070 TaxID=2975962 RepID=UPI0038601D06
MAAPGGGGSAEPPAANPTSTAASPADTPGPSPGSPSPAPETGAGTLPGTSPLTGLPGGAGRVLAVKIDNIVNSRPQTGLNAASVVYAIEVEGGLSRFMAVYDSNHLPPTVGPVRSARESDLQILQQYGKAGFAYSGALTKFLPVLASADVFNASADNVPAPFFRGSSRPIPYNLYLKPEQLMSTLPGAAEAKDIGFRFGPAPAGGTETTDYTVRFPAARFGFTWSPESGKWLVSMDGTAATSTDDGRLGAPTVVVQRVAETTSPRGFEDSPGVLSPFAPTVGSGTATVLRDGKAFEVTWSRPDAPSGTVFALADGQRMAFAPGPVWVVLAPG